LLKSALRIGEYVTPPGAGVASAAVVNVYHWPLKLLHTPLLQATTFQ
jgi:hypothetical protein